METEAPANLDLSNGWSDNGGISYGEFSLRVPGVGSNYSQPQLTNPITNAQIAANEMSRLIAPLGTSATLTQQLAAINKVWYGPTQASLTNTLTEIGQNPTSAGVSTSGSTSNASVYTPPPGGSTTVTTTYAGGPLGWAEQFVAWFEAQLGLTDPIKQIEDNLLLALVIFCAFIGGIILLAVSAMGDNSQTVVQAVKGAATSGEVPVE